MLEFWEYNMRKPPDLFLYFSPGERKRGPYSTRKQKSYREIGGHFLNINLLNLGKYTNLII